mgnify:CR=1 FL=1
MGFYVRQLRARDVFYHGTFGPVYRDSVQSQISAHSVSVLRPPEDDEGFDEGHKFETFRVMDTTLSEWIDGDAGLTGEFRVMRLGGLMVEYRQEQSARCLHGDPQGWING